VGAYIRCRNYRLLANANANCNLEEVHLGEVPEEKDRYYKDVGLRFLGAFI
jgi:hypothetical protein